MTMAVNFPCVVCTLEVRARQHALQGDRWQHRVKCTPDMTLQQYRILSRERDMQWKCNECSSIHSVSLSVSVQPMQTSTDDMSMPQQEPDPVFESTRQTDDISFEIDQVSFQQPEEHVEESVIDPMPSPLDEDGSHGVTYHLVTDGSQKGKDKLVESTGFSYVVKERKGSTVYWVCSVRNKQTRCLATVIDRDGVYSQGKNRLVHPACPGLFTSTKVAKQISEHHIPEDFLQADVRVGNFRHLLFYTEKQLGLLQTSKTWYMDATFSIVRDPFKQLFSIHAFVKSGRETKQIPLASVLMSRRRRIAYKKVFKSMRRRMTPGMTPKAGVADFEAGIWLGFRDVFPRATIRGCSFHWNQAVFRKVQSLGLEESYRRQDATYKLIRKVMSLLVSEGKLRKNQRLRVRRTQGKLYELWKDYANGVYSASQLLRETANLNL